MIVATFALIIVLWRVDGGLTRLTRRYEAVLLWPLRHRVLVLLLIGGDSRPGRRC